MRVVLSDSDTSDVEEMKRCLKRNFQKLDIEVVDTENEEIRKNVRETPPALVILGINRMGANGLDIARELREDGYAGEIIMVSSYGYFEFIKEALLLRAHDYLLKPIIENQLTLSVGEAVEIFEKKELQRKKEKEEEEYIGKVRRQVENGLIYSALFNGEATEEIKEYKKMYKLGDVGYVLNLEIDSGSVVGLKKIDAKIYRRIKDIIKEYHPCVIGPRILNRIIIWIDDSQCEETADAAKERDMELAEKMIAHLREEYKLKISVGIGGRTSIFNMHSSYKEAIRSLRYKRQESVIHIGGIPNESMGVVEYEQLKGKILKNIKFGRRELVSWFGELLDRLRVLQDPVRKTEIYEMLILSGHEAKSVGEYSAEYTKFQKSFNEAWNLPMDELETWAFQKFEFIVNSVQAIRLEIKSDAVNSAISYIEEHYMEEITLEEIARYVGLSPQHFSKIFKEDTGMKYIDWVTNLRIDIAKRLLREGGRTIKEVCYLCGYNDPNYFSRIFRKTAGKSPKEYANSVIL